MSFDPARLDWSDPLTQALAAAAGLALLLVLLLVLTLRAAGRSARLTEPLAQQMANILNPLASGLGAPQVSGPGLA